MNGTLVREILDVRNDAAHAPLDEPREAEADTVTAMLRKVNEVLLALSVVGEAIVALGPAAPAGAPARGLDVA